MADGYGSSNTQPVQFLVVEDDDDIADPMIEGLVLEGFAPIRARTGAEAIESVDRAGFVLLDLGLPDLDGSEVCRRIRMTTDVPIIVVTARDDELDRVRLLEIGADDYVIKPFGFRELVARIRAVLRRFDRSDAPVGEIQDLGGIRIDRRARQVTSTAGQIELTPKEFDLLAFLAEEPGVVRTREEIISKVWDEHWWSPTNTLDVHIASLRRKLGDPGAITTLRGVGYRYDAQ